MNTGEVLGAFRRELREIAFPGETLEALPWVTRITAPGTRGSGVVAYDLDSGNLENAIDTEIRHFRSLGKEFEWKVFSFDSPPELLERLRSRGFTVGAREAVVIYDLQKGLGPFENPFPCEVVRIERVDQLIDFRKVAEAVFQKDYSFTVGELRDALEAGQAGHDAYTAYLDGMPVSIGRLYTHPASKFAGLYGGGTLAEFRGQGLYRAIVAARARDAMAKGARYLQVDALPTSLPILLRLGFVHLADTWPCTYG